MEPEFEANNAHRPIIPPKPDKDKIKLTASPGAGSQPENCPTTTPEPRKSPSNGHGNTPALPLKHSRISVSPSQKPALPPKPLKSQTSSPSHEGSGRSPNALSPPVSSPSQQQRISPPLLPKGRNSISIANAILANANFSSPDINANNNSVQVQRPGGNGPEAHRNLRSVSTPLSPPPALPTSPRPVSSAFTFPNANLNKSVPQSVRNKTVSLGRNVAPPTSPTSVASGVGQFFSNKAATLARMLPLDLNFGKSQIHTCNKPQAKPNDISLQHGFIKNPLGQPLGKSISFSGNSPVPPPPPPRLKKKVSPVNSLSPTSPNPNSPVDIKSPVVEEAVYAEVDKEKKWAARRQKNKEIPDATHNEEGEMMTTISVNKVEDCSRQEDEGIQASLVITINRETEPKSVKVQSIPAIIHGKGNEEMVPVNVKSENELSMPSQPLESIRNNNGIDTKQIGNKNDEVAQVHHNSWLGNHFKAQMQSFENNSISQTITEPEAFEVPEVKVDNRMPELSQSQPSLGANKSFLFSNLSTVGQDQMSDKSSSTITVTTTCSDVHGHETSAKSVEMRESSADPDSLIQSVDNKIQSVVTRLSNLSGKGSPQRKESPPPPLLLHRDFESLTITEAPLSPLLPKTPSDTAIPSFVGNEALKESNGLDADQLSSLTRRRSWNCDSSSPCESSSSSSLTNVRDRSVSYSKGKGAFLSNWVDEGDSTGVLGDVDTSDAQVPNSSNEDIGSSFSLRRKKLWIFNSFGKSSSNTSSSSGNGKMSKRQKEKARSLLPEANGKMGKNVMRQISGPILPPGGITIHHPEVPENNRVEPSSQRDKSHPSVHFSPELLENPAPSHHRVSTGSIGELGECPITPCSSIFPDSERGDNESLCSISSVSTVGTGYNSNISGYEDILAELSQQDKKAFYVAREILTSEQTFIDVLDLLTVDFPQAIRQTEEALKHPIIPPHDLDTILAGLPNLKRVNEELKADIQERIGNWLENPKLADIIVRKGPFLKLYAHYIKNFEKTTQKLDECCQQYPPFMRAVKEFEMSDRCTKLGLKHYMLKPVQRMPQYRLLLEDYLKHLDEQSCDFEDTVKALAIVKDVADHANEAIKLQANSEKLLQLQTRLSGAEIMKADRQLLKEGELTKVCRKDLQPRFFALMNDCLLCMTYNVSAAAGSPKDLKLRNEMPLAGMRVCLSATEDYPHEFSVISTARSFNLIAKSAKEREEWMKALNNAINDNIKKRTCRTPDQEEGFQLGKIAPVWIQDSRVTMCQACTAEFSVTFRRHHCRACGKVVCGHCSGNHAPLQYLKNDAVRVCDECYQYLLEEFDKEACDEGLETSRDTIRCRFKKVTPNVSKRAAKMKRHVPSRLEVHANNSGSRISGYLHWRERKAWKRHWFVLMDRVLYIYAASEDIVAIRSIPVLGWNVDFEKSESMDSGDGDAVFKLTHSGQNTLLFQADSSSVAERWVSAMKEATVLT